MNGISNALSSSTGGLNSSMAEFMSKIDSSGIDLNSAAMQLTQDVSKFNGTFGTDVTAQLNNVTGQLNTSASTLQLQMGSYSNNLTSLAAAPSGISSVFSPLTAL